MSELQAGMVTIADLYRELVGMRTDVGKALTRLEVIDSRNQDADALHKDYEARLRSLEAFRWKIAGMSVALSTGTGILSGVVAYFASRGHLPALGKRRGPPRRCRCLCPAGDGPRVARPPGGGGGRL